VIARRNPDSSGRTNFSRLRKTRTRTLKLLRHHDDEFELTISRRSMGNLKALRLPASERHKVSRHDVESLSRLASPQPRSLPVLRRAAARCWLRGRRGCSIWRRDVAAGASPHWREVSVTPRQSTDTLFPPLPLFFLRSTECNRVTDGEDIAGPSGAENRASPRLHPRDKSPRRRCRDLCRA